VDPITYMEAERNEWADTKRPTVILVFFWVPRNLYNRMERQARSVSED
jgi:hypothetical protein